MKSLFLRMFLWFCGGTAAVVSCVVVAYQFSNPQQMAFDWPSLGRGAIVSAGHSAVAAYERGGRTELREYLQALAEDSGLRGELFDPSERALAGGALAPQLPAELTAQAENSLWLRVRGHTVGVRLRGRDGAVYAFVATVPRRYPRGLWYGAFVASIIVTGAFLCLLLARHMTAPVVHLRTVTSRFSRGDLAARITLPNVLEREDEIGGLARDFNHMAARIQTLMHAQQRLIADVSHELRSPITRLSLALGLVRRQKDGGAHTSLARMEREVERLNVLIGQLLTLSRLESLDQRPVMQRVDLSALVREVAADADFEAASLNRSVQLGECAACSISGSPDLLRSAVENVVRNALRYTAPNSQVEIRLIAADTTGNAEVVVADEGPGIPDDALAHVFEPFYRVDQARDRGTGGAGLGLAITRQIVTLHGGSVRALNREGGGLEVRITLPANGATPRADACS